MDHQQLANNFKRFAELECKGSSELYELLSNKIADDEELLELCTYAQVGQPVPNLLFGAVHSLLLQGKAHPVNEYYASIKTGPKKPADETFTLFKDFCVKHWEEIIGILTTNLVQTNEVRRTAYLYPVLTFIHQKCDKPLSLIEIGSSAGLQLNVDRYRYNYGDGFTYGDSESSVHITSQVKGDEKPDFSLQSPTVVFKRGLDLNTLNLRNKEDAMWLNALIWPEHVERRQLFQAATAYFKDHPVELVEGDGIALLNSIVELTPAESAICIFHTHVANQIPEDLKRQLMQNVKKLGKTRDVFHLYNNMWDRQLHLDYYLNGKEHQNVIGDTDGHGSWFEWKMTD